MSGWSALSNAIPEDTIYTLKLRRGVDIDAPPPSRLVQSTVAEAMERAPAPLSPDESRHEIVERFAAERTDSLPVIADDGTLMGIVAAGDVARAITQDSASTTQGTNLTRAVPRLAATDSLEDAIHALASTDDEGLLVIGENDHLIGRITHRQVLRAYLDRYGSRQASPDDQTIPPRPSEQ